MLIRRARRGDQEAFGALYLRHHEGVARVCRNWVRDVHMAEDATQETFLRAWKALPNFTHEVDFSHWLRRIARNHCHDLWRAGRTRPLQSAVSDVRAERVDPTAEEAVAAGEDRVMLRSLMRRLGRRDAALLFERHVLDLPVQTMSEQWHLTRGTVEVALHRARRRARRYADERGVRALLPVDLCRRVVGWLQRSTNELSGAGGAAVTGLGHLAIVVAVALPQATPPDRPVQTAPRDTVSAPADPAAPIQHEPAVSTRPAASTARAAAAARDRPKDDAKADEPKADEDSDVAVDVPPVRVDDEPPPSNGRYIQVKDPTTGQEAAAVGLYQQDREVNRVVTTACPLGRSTGHADCSQD